MSAPCPLPPQRPLHVLKIAPHYRLQIRIDHDRRGALVLAELRQNLVRDRYRHAERFQRSGDGLLVLRIGK